MTTCSCGNAARYINEHGELCCAICPIKQGLDSIKIASVPALLAFARKLLVGEGSPWIDGHQPHGPILQIDRYRAELREIIGRAPTVEKMQDASGDLSDSIGLCIKMKSAPSP